MNNNEKDAENSEQNENPQNDNIKVNIGDIPDLLTIPIIDNSADTDGGLTDAEGGSSKSEFCHDCFSEAENGICKKCGYDNSLDKKEDFILKPGTIIKGKYKIGRVLGIGGFGITYKVLDTETKTLYAVKEYMPSDAAYRDEETNSVCLKAKKFQKFFVDGLNSFISEANYLVMLKNSENIVNIYDCFNENKTIYYVMEFLDGYTIGKVPNLSFDDIYKAMLEIIKALRKVHEKGLVHRDISPQNIFYLKNSQVRLIDFGNARYYTKKNENDEELILKPGFSPPELYMKKNVQGPWTDVYSLAATFYTLVTRQKVPDALKRIEGEAFTPLKELLPGTDSALDYAVSHALEIDYCMRTKNVDEFLDDINSQKNKNINIISSSGNGGRSKGIFGEKSVNYQNIKEGINSALSKINGLLGSKIDSGIQKINSEVNARRKYKNINAPRNQNTARRLCVLSYDNQIYYLKSDTEFIIGRNFNTCHLAINDINISRKHCTIEYDEKSGEIYLTDFSSNGTFINYSGGKIENDGLSAETVRLINGKKYKLDLQQSFYLFSVKYEFKVVLR